MRTGPPRIALGAVVTCTLAYLLFPVLVVVVISFSSVGYLRFPPPSLSLRWYAKLLDTPAWIESFWVTLEVGSLTMAFATLLGVPAAFALLRLPIRGKAALNALLLMALITPSIIKGLATYLFFVPYGLINSVVGLACAQTVSALPYVVINVGASLKGFDATLERAAIIHGARPLTAILRITLPIIAPGILVGAVFAFLSSAQELLVAIFLLGTVRKPLAVKMWEGVRESVDPTIAAASSGVILMAVALFVVAALLQKRARRLYAR
ncbi:MAG TPA: ABC transporter permease [Candidatus Methylomirabilis sp.]|nr:ABC transporter permease [Candidatus Methylomirabilis sp.]